MAGEARSGSGRGNGEIPEWLFDNEQAPSSSEQSPHRANRDPKEPHAVKLPSAKKSTTPESDASGTAGAQGPGSDQQQAGDVSRETPAKRRPAKVRFADGRYYDPATGQMSMGDPQVNEAIDLVAQDREAAATKDDRHGAAGRRPQRSAASVERAGVVDRSKDPDTTAQSAPGASAANTQIDTDSVPETNADAHGNAGQQAGGSARLTKLTSKMQGATLSALGRRRARKASGSSEAETVRPDSNQAWGHAPTKAQRLIGLDGLRALAVLTVMAFHFQVPGFSGGFLGVDMFFVLSGYLITSQLWTRWGPGKLAFGKFWLARVRRLAPAVLTLIAVTILAMAIWHPAGLMLHLKDSLAAVTYTSNWWYIFGGRPYGDFGNWWFLEHLWSLAIEEQFYVLWPIVVAIALTLVKSQPVRRKVMMGVAAGGAVLSTALMTYYAFTYGGEGNIDPSRQYFGTDSHAMGLLVGAALAFYLDGAGFKGAQRHLPRASFRLTVAGALAVAAALITMTTVEFSDLGMYRYGGFLVFSLVVGLAVAAAAHPGPLANVLGHRALKFVGDRSYGLYLWHWPLVTVPWVGEKMRENWVWPAVFLTIATFVLAELSYRFIEMPVRSKGFKGALFTPRQTAALTAGAGTADSTKADTTPNSDGSSATAASRGAGAKKLATRYPVVAGLLTLMLVGGAFTAYRALAPQPCDAKCQEAKKVAATMEKLKQQDAARKKQHAQTKGKAQPTVKATDPTVPGLDRKSTRHLTVSVWGDSVPDSIAEGQMPYVFKSVTNNAVVAQQSWTVFDRLRKADKAGLITQDVVLIHVGDNGFVNKGQLQSVVDELKGHTVVLVSPKTTIPEGVQARESIEAVAKDNPQVKFVDWYNESRNHPEYFVDGVHLKSEAEPAYLKLVQKAITGK